MAKIKASDLLVINRNNTDYKAEVSELGIPSVVSDLTNDAGYITVDEVPEVDLDPYALKTEIPTDNADLSNGAGYITLSEVPEVDLDGYATEEWVEGKKYITLDEVPDPDLEGALIFRGSVANESELPGDAVQGDLYYNEDDNHLYAKGDDDWHKVGQVDDIDLSVYALKTEIPTDNADLANGANYITLAEVPEVDLDDYALKTELPTDNADLANGAGYITVEALPKDVSDLNNDLGFITLSDLPDRVTIDELPELEG